ncbi:MULTISPECIES: hypothetical protein [Xanthomonas]|uniref:hypothetical protein n=1 Tax=Xanthomonas TaxID=338 RepID=UPI0006FB0B04|nr:MULTISPECIES: hypothetical protein [Xanthomonas]KQR12677.1 hypothetical protein ASF90_05350 [Xanthomonas sp. Leaf148]
MFERLQLVHGGWRDAHALPNLPSKRGAMTCQRGAAIVAVLRNVLMWDEGRRVLSRHAIA